MSIITRIEGALLGINDARFHELSDTYLTHRGYEGLHAVGRVPGAEKSRTGTPDSFFLPKDGKYIFVECTTQAEDLVAKFLADVTKCFDSSKTGLPPGSVTEVVLCHNRRLDTKDLEPVRVLCEQNGATLSPFGLNRIAQDLYRHYPGLARDFLEIQVDTGQIVTLDDFIEAYETSPVATPLSTKLKFREQELAQLLTAVEEYDIVLVSGPPGVGKTRLAIEACRKFAEAHGATTLRAIRNVQAELYEDLRVHLSPDGHYVVFVDDANRISGFKYICAFFSEAHPGRKIKIVATVRDYAIKPVRETAEAAAKTSLLKIEPLSDEQIREFLSEEFGITNHEYQFRIARISNGNPRLAVMAAKLARERNTLESIADASALYDEYFKSIRRDIDQLDDPALLRAAFLVALFRRLDKSNENHMRIADELFGLSPDALWDAVRRLHQAEVVDIYEDEVARVADQVLATYLVYFAVFRTKVVSLKSVLLQLFPALRRPLIDLLAPVVNVFHGEELDGFLRSQVDSVWQEFKKAENEDAIWELMDVFWFVRPAETLSELSRQIDVLERTTVVAESIEFSKQGSPHLQGILQILAHFRADPVRYPAALDLVFRYLDVHQEDARAVFYLLTHTFGVTHRSHLYAFHTEQLLLDKLWQRTREGEDELLSLLYIATAEPFLKTHFSPSESYGEKSVTIFQYNPPASPEFLALRKLIWERLFRLLQRSDLYRRRVIDALQAHSQSGYEVGNKDVVSQDAAVALPLIRAHCDPSSFRETLAVHDYLALLERVGIPFDNEIREHFATDTFRLSEVLLVDPIERAALGRKEYQAQQAEEWVSAAAELKPGEVGVLLNRCGDILSVVRGGHREYQFQQSLRGLLLAVAARDAALFEEAFRELIGITGALAVEPFPLIAKLIEQAGVERAYEIVQAADSTVRTRWLLAYFFLLPAPLVTGEKAAELCKLYEYAPFDQLIYGLGFLLKYVSVAPTIVPAVTEILLKKGDPRVGAIFSGAFDHEKEFADQLLSLYAGRVDLLKQAYVAGSQADRHSDSHAETFSRILDLDPNFATEWVRFIYWSHQWPSDHDDDRDYAALWKRADYSTVMNTIVRAVAERHREQGFLGGYLTVFFNTPPRTDAQLVRQRQDEFLSEFIAQNAHDDALMEVVFSVVCRLDANRRREHIRTFVAHNTKVGSFERLPLEPNHWGPYESFVPTLRRRIEFLELLLAVLTSRSLLDHCVIVERRIAALRQDIQWERKRDFLRD